METIGQGIIEAVRLIITGLAIFLIFMRRGPLGSLQLNYTVPAMIVAQICLVTPIIAGLTYNIVREKAPVVNSLGITLGAVRGQNPEGGICPGAFIQTEVAAAAIRGILDMRRERR